MGGSDRIARLRALISYDAATGLLTWRNREDGYSRAKWWNSRFAGKPAISCPSDDGYLVGIFDGRSMKAHRVAWAIVHGEWPPQIDHINGDTSDNRLVNLRAADAVLNGQNQKRRTDNKSGVTGVYWSKRRRAFEAYINAGRRRVHLGWFKRLDDASACRSTAETEYGYHPNHGGARS